MAIPALVLVLSPQCLAISPDDSLIAAGDASGRILLWRSFAPHVPTAGSRREAAAQTGPKPVPPPPTTLHWHSHAVGCLAFSPDGSFLMSGGAQRKACYMHTGSNTFCSLRGTRLTAARYYTFPDPRSLHHDTNPSSHAHGNRSISLLARKAAEYVILTGPWCTRVSAPFPHL